MWHKLPPPLQAILLAEWIADLRDIVHMDIAYCCRSLRSAYLDSLHQQQQEQQQSNFNLDVNSTCDALGSLEYLRWLCSRQVPVRSLSLDVPIIKQLNEDATITTFPMITKLSLSKNKYMKVLEPTDFMQFFRKFPNLRVLDCSPCTFNIKDELLIVIVNAIAKEAIDVIEVNIMNCPNITDQATWNLATKLPHLLALHTNSSSLSFITWQTVLDCCSSLHTVSLCISMLSSQELVDFVSKSKLLQNLTLYESDFDDNYQVDQGTTNDSSGSSREELKYAKITMDLIFEIFQARPGSLLRFIALPASSAAFSDPAGALQRLLAANPQLQTLQLSSSFYQITPCMQFHCLRHQLAIQTTSEDALLTLLNTISSNLQVLDISPILSISSWLLQAISNRFGQSLQMVKLCLAGDVKAVHLRAFLANAPHLQVLHLNFQETSYCLPLSPRSTMTTTFSEEPEEDICAHLPLLCPGITSLGMVHCKGLSDERLQALVERYGSQLTHIDVSHCPLISGAILSHLNQHCRRLRKLEALGTRITLDCLAGFQRKLDLQRGVCLRAAKSWNASQPQPQGQQRRLSDAEKSK